MRELAVEVTQDETTQFEKAVALQDWFRESGGFEYSLATADGNGYDALVRLPQRRDRAAARATASSSPRRWP